MKALPIFSLFSAALFAQVFAAPSDAADTSDGAPKKVAIFVRNDSGSKVLDAKTKALEYSLASRLNGAGFGVVDYDLAVRNLNDYLGDPNARYRKAAAAVKKSLNSDESLGSALIEQASGVRIGELVGADYVLSVSLASLTMEKRIFDGYFVNTENAVYRLRLNYNLYENGGSVSGVSGDSVTVSKSVRATESMSVENGDIVDSLLDSAAESAAKTLAARNSSGKISRPSAKMPCQVEIAFDIAGLEIPEIVFKDGKYALGSNVVPVRIASVNAEIDGITHTIGGKITLSRGIHTLRINQRDIAPVEKNINVTGEPGQRISFSLQLDESARRRWKNDMEFLESMKERARASENARMLTEAEADRIRGIAKMYEQSGFKIDADSLPEIRKTQSIFGQ